MSNTTVVKNISVINMIEEHVLTAQDVVIYGSKIAKIAPSGSLKPNEDALILDGSDKYLLPGLFDMHAHVNEKRFLSLFLMNGVTAVRDLGNTDDNIFQLKADLHSGKTLGPRLFVSGKILEGDPPFWEGFEVIKTSAEAIDAVRKLKSKNADQIKVYHTLSPELHSTIIREAHKLGMKVTGHVPRDLTPVQALEAGQDGIEHLSSISGYAGSVTHEKTKDPDYEGWSEFTGYAIKKHELQKLINACKKYHAYFCPTIIVGKQISALADYESLAKSVDTNFTDARHIRENWNPNQENASANIKGVRPLWFKNYGVVEEGSRKLVPYMAEGATILAGSDTPNPFVVPGFSLHAELEALVSAGLSNYQALKAATINPARWLNVESELGTIEEGKIANLLVLNKNPLKDISNTNSIEVVLLNGVVHKRSRLEKMARLKG